MFSVPTGMYPRPHTRCLPQLLPLPPLCAAQAFCAVDEKRVHDKETMAKFLADPVHLALATCSTMRPPVDISVGGENSSVGVGAGAARTEFRSTVSKS